MTNNNWAFDTLAIHAGQTPDSDTGSRALPLYQTTAFVFDSATQAADRFALKELGPIYTRLNNPTNEVLENRVAALEGGVGALAVASGMAAISLTVFTITQAGQNIVASPSLYGGTSNQFRHSLNKLGIEVRFVQDPGNPQEWIDLADENTTCFFGEVIPNPKNDIFDIEPIAAAAHSVGVPLIVDSTVATPYLCRPIEFGADIVIHSASKYLNGHGTAIVGVIVDSGNFDFGADPKRYPSFNTPDPSYNGIVYARDLGKDGAFGVNLSFILKARVQGQRDFGFALAPFNSWLTAQGIETLSLRMERHCSNALTIAKWLENHPQVASVSYAGLESSPYYQLAQKYCPRGAASVVTFDLKGGREAGAAFVDALKLHSNLVNIGDTRSTVTHPASTTHSQSNTEELLAAGITEGTIRLSVGIEDVNDLLADLELGFAASAGK